MIVLRCAQQAVEENQQCRVEDPCEKACHGSWEDLRPGWREARVDGDRRVHLGSGGFVGASREGGCCDERDEDLHCWRFYLGNARRSRIELDGPTVGPPSVLLAPAQCSLSAADRRTGF